MMFTLFEINHWLVIYMNFIIVIRDLSDNDIHQLETDSFTNYTQVKETKNSSKDGTMPFSRILLSTVKFILKTQLHDLFLKNNQLNRLPQQLQALSGLRNM